MWLGFYLFCHFYFRFQSYIKTSSFGNYIFCMKKICTDYVLQLPFFINKYFLDQSSILWFNEYHTDYNWIGILCIKIVQKNNHEQACRRISYATKLVAFVFEIFDYWWKIKNDETTSMMIKRMFMTKSFFKSKTWGVYAKFGETGWGYDRLKVLKSHQII